MLRAAGWQYHHYHSGKKPFLHPGIRSEDPPDGSVELLLEPRALNLGSKEVTALVQSPKMPLPKLLRLNPEIPQEAQMASIIFRAPRS